VSRHINSVPSDDARESEVVEAELESEPDPEINYELKQEPEVVDEPEPEPKVDELGPEPVSESLLLRLL